MRRLGALALKELRQHGIAFGLLSLFLGATWCVLALGVLLAPDTVTWLEVHAEFMRFFFVPAALALGNRLVVKEYHARTQLFLEGLPLRRVEMLLVKMSVGLAMLGGASATSLLFTVVLASAREPIDAVFVVVLAARTAVFVLFLWFWFFAMGLLGRLRAAIYAATLIGFGIVVALTEIELLHFGPIELVGPQMPLERTNMPAEALAWTGAMAGSFLLLSLLLGTLREGSFAESLARRMTQREKVIVGVLVIAGLVTLAEVDPPNQRPAFEFPERGVLRVESPPLEILYGQREERPDAERLADRLRPELSSLSRSLGWEVTPMVRVALRRSLDTTTYEPVDVGEDDGVLLRANFSQHGGDGWDENAFVAEVLARTIVDHTDGRASLEQLAWLRDGYAAHRAYPNGALAAPIAARALVGMQEREPTLATLSRWDALVEQEGVETARAIAVTAWRAMVRACDEERSGAVARVLFEETPSRSIVPVLRLRWNPPARVIEEQTGLAPPAFERAWAETLRAMARRPDAISVIGGSATIEVVRDGGARDILIRARLNTPPEHETVLSVGHIELGPHDVHVSPWDEQRDDIAWPIGEREAVLRLIGRYGAGDRVRIVVDVSSPSVGGMQRLAVQRLEVP